MNSFVLAECTTVDAALSQLKDGAVVKAGGIDLLERMKNGTSQPSRLVNIRNISALRGIQETQNGLTIGALTTLSEISEHPVIQTQYQILSDACGHAATPIFATWQRSAEIFFNRYSAGIIDRPNFNAFAKAKISALRLTDLTSTTPSWITVHAPLSHRPHLRWRY